MLLAIDPGRSNKGDKSIGYALFYSNGRELERGSLRYAELSERLDLSEGCPRPLLYFGYETIDEVVIEDFVNNAQSRGGQTNGTSECIGMVEFVCFKAGVPFTRQRPAILSVAKLHAGYEQKLKHLPHQDSAYLHGYYYLVSKGLQPRGLADTI